MEKEEALTPEERRVEILRRQRLQEEADLRLAMETFGLSTLVDFSDRKSHKKEKKWFFKTNNLIILYCELIAFYL